MPELKPAECWAISVALRAAAEAYERAGVSIPALRRIFDDQANDAKRFADMFEKSHGAEVRE